jgi:hypothetical protein
MVVQPQLIEITALLAGAAVLLFLAGAGASMLWLGRLP